MLNGVFPVFAKGRVLKKESIEYLRDFPYELASLAYEKYSDGVLSGFSASVKDGRLFVSKGAVKYKNNIIAVSENIIEIAETDYERFLYIKLITGELRETPDYKICPVEIKTDASGGLLENEIELGRFCLNPGAVLRCEYDSFSDLRTPENTLDVTRVYYAGIGGPTLHPAILKEYARAWAGFPAEPADLIFVMMCLNSDVIHRPSIEYYISAKTGGGCKEYRLPELYLKLEELLPQSERKRSADKPRGRIIIE